MHERGILLTGASGYLGLALAKRLASGTTARVWAPSRSELDLAKEDWSNLEPPFPIDVVVHAAASRERSDGSAHRYPEEIRINVDATARLYEWARARRVRALVVNVVGPDAVFELDMLQDLGAHLGTEPALQLDPETAPLAFAPSTARADALFPRRIRTPWREGLARSFPRLR